MTPDDARSAPPGGGPTPLYFNTRLDNLDLTTYPLEAIEILAGPVLFEFLTPQYSTQLVE